MAPRPQDPHHIDGQLSFLDATAEHLPTMPAEAARMAEPAGLAEPALSAEPAGLAEPALTRSVAPDKSLPLTGPNTRVRAGNAMQRARAGAIRGALETLQRRGLKRLTMAETADRGGLARATLYNHVRDKEQLVALLLAHESQAVADAFMAAPDLEAALRIAATMVADHPALVGVRQHDPAALARLGRPEDAEVRALTSAALAAHGCRITDANIELVLRWLASFAASPSDAPARAAQAAALARSLG